MYWFAPQQQISTFRWQKIGLFYLKFNGKCNEFLKATESGQKTAKTKIFQKTAYTLVFGA